jgi:CheY-like chemotaxis protein
MVRPAPEEHTMTQSLCPDASPPTLAHPAAHPLDIVLVEDDADIRETLRMLLELYGHAVREAEDGPHGIALIRARAPDVALVDIGLPGVSGYEVARTVRGALPATHLVAMTGYGRPGDECEARRAGFDLHLVKPVDVDRLRALLDELGAG